MSGSPCKLYLAKTYYPLTESKWSLPLTKMLQPQDILKINTREREAVKGQYVCVYFAILTDFL